MIARWTSPTWSGGTRKLQFTMIPLAQLWLSTNTTGGGAFKTTRIVGKHGDKNPTDLVLFPLRSAMRW